VSQAALFPIQEKARRRRHDPETSLWAAQGIDVTATQALVLSAFINGEATDDQLYERICHYWPDKKVTPQSVRSRRAELVSKGLVKWTGSHGISANGGKARVWGRA
jgi:hypothetical protein